MKRVFLILLTAAMVFSLAACGSKNTKTDEKPDSTAAMAKSDNTTESDTDTAAEPSADKTDSGKKVLIAYFSATGTTKRIAEFAAKATNGDLYEIVPAEPYTSDDLDYSKSDCRANKEMNDKTSRPKINGTVKNMADYDIVFIGYPIWWGEAPRIIATFVEQYDFKDKTVVTFCTSGSNPNDDSAIKALADGANWISGKRFNGNASQSDVADWIDGLSLDITVKK